MADIKTLILTKNNLQSYYNVQVKNSSGAVVDITGATIYCKMKLIGSSMLKINRQTTGIYITDAVNGKFEYHWQAGDTDTIGTYDIQFEIQPPSGGRFDVPKIGIAKVVIADSLDGI